MDNAEISICIPVYNAEKYIEETIKSVLNQSFSNFELIIIDNHSTDDTVNIVKEFKDERIKLFQNNKNLGMVRNWNECLNKVQGKYIQFVCSDDVLYKECLKEKIELMKKNNNIVMVVSNTDIIDSNGKKIITDEKVIGIPSLINVVDEAILKDFLKKLDKVDKDILSKISEIEYTPNEYENDLFLLYINDGNYVYITTTRVLNMNKYNEVLEQLDGKKGILYLDSGNHFKIMDE